MMVYTELAMGLPIFKGEGRAGFIYDDVKVKEGSQGVRNVYICRPREGN